MNIEPKCCSCKKYIKNNNVLYMCVDNTFCSMPCRNKHLRYITNFDPEFNYPDKWNINANNNNNYSAKVDCMIEVDYLHFPISNSKQKLYRSQSLTNLLDHKHSEKMVITCVKLYMFNIKLTDKKVKLISTCLLIILISTLIRYENS